MAGQDADKSEVTSVVTQEQPADDESLNLIRALENLSHLGFPHITLAG
jgi:hypothetical protein